MDTPSISVIIPVYNTEAYIGQCLDSVMHQQGAPSYEVIVVDDRTPDRAMDIVGRYAGIRVIRRAVNGGLSEARNDGIRAARGRYLFFLDSDDMILPDTLMRLWRHVEQHPDVTMVYGQMATDIPKQDMTRYLDLSTKGLRDYDNRPARVRRAHSHVPETAPNRLINSKWLSDNRLFFTPGIVHEDFDWHLRALPHVESYAFESGAPTYIYRLRSESITDRQSRLGRRRAVYGILQHVVADLPTIDRYTMRIIVDNLLGYKFLSTQDDDVAQYRAIVHAVRSHTSARWSHRFVMALTRLYRPWMPLRPIYSLLRL